MGLLVGRLYSLFGVGSPAPLVVALVGLFRILAGEQLPPVLRMVWAREPAAHWCLYQTWLYIFDHRPRGGTPEPRRAGLWLRSVLRGARPR